MPIRMVYKVKKNVNILANVIRYKLMLIFIDVVE